MNSISLNKKIPYKTAFVVNPTSGGGYAGKCWPQIEDVLKNAGQHYRVYFTGKRGEGTTLAERAAEDGAELVVAVGGDGTLFEVVNGIDLIKNIFAFLPLGTGNGFKSACALPSQWLPILQGLATWKPQLIDLGVINNRYFLNVVGIGFDAAVAAMASQKYGKVKEYAGNAAYLAAFFDELIGFESFCARLKGDRLEIVQQDALLVAVANGSYYGGGFRIAPQAVINDGELDLIVVRRQNNPETTLLAFQALVGKHLDNSAVISTKITDLLIDADRQVLVQVDGEITGTLPVRIGIRPKALRILVP